MNNYEFLKKYINDNINLNKEDFNKSINKESYDNDLKITLLLCFHHAYAFYSFVIKYLPDNTKNYSYIYFRFFYFFYILIKYVYNHYETKDVKQIFTNYIRYARKYRYHSDTKLYDKIVNNFIENYDYLYDTFFVKDNIYFNVYFNNLIKYFMPLPYEYLAYIPIITYRNNVTTFYKKNDIDYLEKPMEYDSITPKHMVGVKNIDSVNNEIDIHIPIEYFNLKNHLDDYIYLIAIKRDNEYLLYITEKINLNDNQITLNKIAYERTFKTLNRTHLKNSIPFQMLFQKWTNSTKTLSVSIDKVIYISVTRKIKDNELFNVFSTMDFNKSKYKYLFHNTPYDVEKSIIQHINENISFFYLTPFGSQSYQETLYKDRKCLIFQVKKDINNLLDLTESIITNNPFTSASKIKTEHHEKKLWTYYDHAKIMDYYDNEVLDETFDYNNKCITIKDPHKMIKERPYCDVGTKKHYVGRRKLYEIMLKTRKYASPFIYVTSYLEPTYQENGYNYKDYINDALYLHPFIIKANTDAYLYDAIMLQILGYRGFYFTDFDRAIEYGGEIMLVEPKNYLKLDKYSNKLCHVKTDFIQNKLQSGGTNKYAYVALLMGNSPYIFGALVLGISLKKTNTNNDIVIMVTSDVPEIQKEKLKQIYDFVIDIEFITVNKTLIKDYETNRFKDIFTKLQCLTLTQYEKIIMLDIDMLVIKNMDHLFELDVPAACLRREDYPHNKKISKELIIKNNKLIGGINAGLMLLEPNKDEYDRIINDLINLKDTEFINPEQDYLSKRYVSKWTNISFLYNFQFGLSKRANKYNPDEVFNIHYSSRLKPWRILSKPEETWSWINENPQQVPYYKLWLQYYEEIKKTYNLDLMHIVDS